MTTNDETQIIESVEQTESIISEVFNSEEKILPDASPEEQYQFARNFLKVGDYDNAEKAFREFVLTNPENELSGNAQYWYAETYRIRQMYTDAATAYLEGYQKYPKSKIAPENLLKLGVSLVQMGEKDQGCLMIAGVKNQYPNATQSVLQKAKYYEEKEFKCKKKTHNFYSKNLKNKRIKKIYLNFKNNLASYSPKKLSVAVSGGADSIALVFLVKCYALENKLKTFFYIVDHKLRKDSTLEARLVKKKLSSFNILCEILTLKTYRNKSNIQSFARNNRYNVIFKKCLKNKVDYLLTAHHKDDYVENFL